MPPEVKNLLVVVKLRNLGARTGFEKIIVKNGMQIMFFVSNPMSGYYQSKQFERVIDKVNDNAAIFKVNQDKGKLRTVSRGVVSLDTALKVLQKLQ
jgi:transcription-repair coupling factor (superfamily II helicase)